MAKRVREEEGSRPWGYVVCEAALCWGVWGACVCGCAQQEGAGWGLGRKAAWLS